MRKMWFLPALAALAIGVLATPLGASPRVEVVNDWDVSGNMTALGYSANISPLTGPGSAVWNSDLAFQGDMVVQGTYDGFVFHDVTYPSRPRVILNYEDCAPGGVTTGNQGDITIYGNILTRSWNSNTPAAGSTCDGQPVAPGFEGLHVFDISNKQNPQLVAQVDLACGSHTASAIPDPANGRLLVYNGSSSGACTQIDIIEIPLANPAGAFVKRVVPTEAHPCHDIGIILGEAMKVACAGGNSLGIYSIGGADGGSFDDPLFMHHTTFDGVTIGHSAAFTFDGKYVVFGHEPGGGTQAQCETIDPEVNRTLFFVEVETGEIVARYVQERPQTALENCTWHNYNLVPLKNKSGKPRYVLVSGNYQMGTIVLDFTDLPTVKQIAYADPPPLNPAAFSTGGSWSSYWYNGRIYEADTKRGLIIWRLDDPRVSTFLRTPHLNPQTAEFTINQ